MPFPVEIRFCMIQCAVDMKRVAVYPGTFDPITNGHIDLINRALEFVDELIIAILVNSEKKPLFSVQERIQLIKQVLPENKRIRIEQFDGLLVDYASKSWSSNDFARPSCGQRFRLRISNGVNEPQT